MILKSKEVNVLNKTNKDIFKNFRYSEVFKEFGKMLGYKWALSLVYIKIVAIRPTHDQKTLPYHNCKTKGCSFIISLDHDIST